MKIYVNDGQQNITFALCGCDEQRILPENLKPIAEHAAQHEFTEIGDAHNKILAELRKRTAPKGSEEAKEIAIKASMEIKFSEAINDRYDMPDYDEILKGVNGIIDGCFPPFFPPLRVPDWVTDFIWGKFNGLLYRISTFREDTDSIHELHRYILEAERDIINADMSRKTRERALWAFTTADRSLRYWHGEYLSTYGPHSNSNDGSPAHKWPWDKFWKAVRKSAADTVACLAASEFGPVVAVAAGVLASDNQD